MFSGYNPSDSQTEYCEQCVSEITVYSSSLELPGIANFAYSRRQLFTSIHPSRESTSLLGCWLFSKYPDRLGKLWEGKWYLCRWAKSEGLCLS